MKKAIFFTVIASFYFISCNKNNDNIGNLTCSTELSIDVRENYFILNWTKTELPNFESYLIERSDEPLDNSIEPTEILFEITDPEITSYFENSIPLYRTVYYKIYVKAGGKVICSATANTETGNQVLDFLVYPILKSDNPDILYFFRNGETSAIMYRYDYKNDIFTHQVNIGSKKNLRAAISTYNNKQEIYVSHSDPSTVSIFDADDLLLITSFTPSTNVSQIAAKNGLIFFLLDAPTPLVVYDRESLDSVFTVNDLYQEPTQYLNSLPGDPTQILVHSFNNSTIFTFDSGGQLIDTYSRDIHLEWALLPTPYFSLDEEYLVLNVTGVILDRNLIYHAGPFDAVNIFGTFTVFVFSPDNSSIYAFEFHEGLWVSKFSIQSGDLIDKKPLKYKVVHAFIDDTGKYVIIGATDKGKTIIEILDEII